MAKKQIKVAYFPSTAMKTVVMGSNGKSLDRYCTRLETEEDINNGNYVLDGTFLLEDNLQDLLQEEVILKVLMDYGEEIFRISKVRVGTRYIDVVARQITIADSLTLYLKDVRPTNLNGQGAATWLLDNAEGNKEIQILSNIVNTNTAYYKDKSLYSALHDSDNSFSKRWGGEILRRQYTETINIKIGVDRGFTIREGKNLTGFECNSNIDNLITRAKGKGYNGIEGNYIDSPLINNYNAFYTSAIEYSDVKVKDENNDEGYDTLQLAIAELDRRVNEEFEKNDVDKIKASYTINFVQLEKTEEYKNYIIAERVYIGDTIRVYVPRLDVDIKVRAINKKYDCLAQKTKEIKLSNYIEPKALSIKQIIDRIDELQNVGTSNLQQAKDYASALIKAGLKNSNVIVKENEIIIGDTKDINTMTKVWRFNVNGLGYSSTGYYGEFGLAMTMDGQIVADFITAGILNAEIIKAGILKSRNGKWQFNLDGETFNLGDKLIFDGTNLTFGDDVTLSWEQVTNQPTIPTTAAQVGAKPANYQPTYSEITGTKPPTNADNTAGYVGNRLTKITSTGVYTGTIVANQIAAHTISIEHLTSATKDPIIKLFGGCSIDATLNNEQGIGTAVRFKWDNNNYVLVRNGEITFYINGVAYQKFLPGICDLPNIMYFGGQCKIDCSGGTFRQYISKSADTGIRTSADGTVSFMVNGVPAHSFNPNGTKSGGTIEVDGTTFGMSPIDSPKVLIEDVLFNQNVLQTGTTIKLDNTFANSISEYAVFSSNSKVDIISKDKNSFYVEGFTGKCDFRIVGTRIGTENQYYEIMGGED